MNIDMEQQLNEDSSANARRGHLFLKVCDMRRAVIGLNAAQTIMTLWGMIAFSTATIQWNRMHEGDEDMFAPQRMTGFVFRFLFTFFCHLAAIAGGIFYNKWAVGAQAVYGSISLALFLVGWIRNLVLFGTYFITPFSVFSNLIRLAYLTVFVVYPNASFAYQVHVGVMTPDTYPRERFSMFCFDNEKRVEEETNAYQGGALA